MRQMTAADLCDECGLPASMRGRNLADMFLPGCQNCRHKTPSERVVEAADLCDECELTGQTATTVLVPPFDSYEKEGPCPNCRHQTLVRRVVEAARVVRHIRMLAHADGMTMSRGTDLKWALADLEEAVADLNR